MSFKSASIRTLKWTGGILAAFTAVATLVALQRADLEGAVNEATQDLNNRLQYLDPKVATQFSSSERPVIFDTWQSQGYSGIYLAQSFQNAATESASCFQIKTIVTDNPGLYSFSAGTAIISAQSKNDADNATVWCKRPGGGYAMTSEYLLSARND